VNRGVTDLQAHRGPADKRARAPDKEPDPFSSARRSVAASHQPSAEALGLTAYGPALPQKFQPHQKTRGRHPHYRPARLCQPLYQRAYGWLTGSVKDTVRLTTYQGYERICRLHIKPSLGGVRLKDSAVIQVRGLYRERLEAGLAPRMMQLVHVTLHKALKQAVVDSLVPHNVAEAVKAPQPEKKEIKPLSPKQAQTLPETAKGDRSEALYVLATTTGMRQGELLGLKWEDINLEGGTLQVRRTLSTQAGKGFSFSPPKTVKGRRSIKLPEVAKASLRKHHEAQLEERTKPGGMWEDNDLAFTIRVGTPLRRQELITRSFKPLLSKVGLPDIRFHDLRHTCATILLDEGVHAKLVQELLGHATISITLATYSHVLPGMGDAAAGAMDDTLG
jgi:integrase